jgi:SAM-dependent methyltransferase
MKSSYRNCPICNNSEISVIRNLKYAMFDDSPLSDSYNLVLCNKCGFIYCDTESTSEDFYNYYTKNLHYFMNNSSGNGTLNTEEKNRYTQILYTLHKYTHDKNSKIIDIGSANGGFLKFLKQYGYNNLLAIDLIPECIEYIKTNNINAKIGSTDCIPMEFKSADIIVLSHVLEHVSNLRYSIDQLNYVLKDDGIIYVEVPIINQGSSFKDAPVWDFLYEHINYFTIKHLILLFEPHFTCIKYNIREIQNKNGKIKCACVVFKKNVQPLSELKIPEEISLLSKEKTPCYVWGISQYMQYLIENTPIKDCNIISFLDISKYKQTKTIYGIPIKSPEILKNSTPETVVIFAKEPYSNDMNKYLDEINFVGKRIII